MKTLMLLVLLCATVTLSGATTKSRLFKRSLLCPAAWLEREGRCFRYVPTRLTWAKAEKYCQAMGANLASVHSADEYHDIQKLIAKDTQGFGRTWLGGSDCQNEGVWLWSDGSPFNYRHCGRFDNRWWKQHCLQMNYGANKCWDDVQCYAKLPSVCAKKPRTRLG